MACRWKTAQCLRQAWRALPEPKSFSSRPPGRRLDTWLVMNNSIRSVLVFLFDLLSVAIAWIGGMWIRFNFDLPDDYVQKLWLGLGVLLVIHAIACRWAGLYRGMWIFASLPDLKRVLRAVTVSGFALVVLLALDRSPGPVIPRSMLVLYPLLLLMVMGGGRAAWRMWKEHRI